ncbi:MAG: hypothetical protein DRR19_03700 [Candidatus Parabeggiatoa sp. nov. 1]|nr:MAG: hypothetical protein DRR19_03700 [Gammaproteobacteria bacterium]
MLCPFCLSNVKFQKEKQGYFCPKCKEIVSAKYVSDYRRFPPVVLSTIGFRGHGKTVYLASLFHALRRMDLPTHWPDFYTMALSDESLDTLDENAKILESGYLPDSTPKNFPKPTIVQVGKIPFQPDSTLLCYDTGGESFEKGSQIGKYASFVSHSQTVLFLLSIPDLRKTTNNIVSEMERLLTVYINGVSELGGDTRQQHIVVVYTKADEWVQSLSSRYQDLKEYLALGTIEGLSDHKNYRRRLYKISQRLQELTNQHLKAGNFVSTAKAKFASLRFSIISALGSSPVGGELSAQITPRRVLDPLFWIMEKQQPIWRQVWRYYRFR